MKITLLTRRNIVDALALERLSWNGSSEETECLSRLMTEDDDAFLCAPAKAHAPISMRLNRWSSIHLQGISDSRLLPPDRPVRIDFMAGSEVSILRQPSVEGDMLPFKGRLAQFSGNRFWNVNDDLSELNDLFSTELEIEHARKSSAAPEAIEPADDRAPTRPCGATS